MRTYHEGLKPTRKTGTFYFGGNRNFLLWSSARGSRPTRFTSGGSKRHRIHLRNLILMCSRQGFTYLSSGVVGHKSPCVPFDAARAPAAILRDGRIGSSFRVGDNP